MNYLFSIMRELRKFRTKFKHTFHGGGYSYLQALCCLLWCAIRFGASPDDFYRYELYKKSNYERNKFITYRRSKRIIKRYNSKNTAATFSEKTKFNIVFSEYLNRGWLDLSSASSDEISSFLEKHDKVIMKPLNGGQGKGIFIVTKDEYESFRFSEYKDYLMEEVLVQHTEMARLNPSSVNTIRVLTFKGKVIACALRIGGTNAVVDNLHSNGVCAHLEIHNGIIDALCRNNEMEQFLYHPISKIVLVGFQVPHWDIVISTVQSAAAILPDVAYIGWDVAVLNNGVAIIEGNHDPGHDVVQMIAQNGLYQEIRKLK